MAKNKKQKSNTTDAEFSNELTTGNASQNSSQKNANQTNQSNR